MSAPLLNFQAYNPVDTAIQAYMNVGQGRNTQLQNQQRQAELPYAAQLKQEQLMKEQLANKQTRAGEQWWGQNAENDAYLKQVEAQFAPRAAVSDIRYKEALGTSAMLNSQMLQIQTALATAESPYKIAQLQLDAQINQMMQDAIKARYPGASNGGQPNTPSMANPKQGYQQPSMNTSAPGMASPNTSTGFNPRTAGTTQQYHGDQPAPLAAPAYSQNNAPTANNAPPAEPMAQTPQYGEITPQQLQDAPKWDKYIPAKPQEGLFTDAMIDEMLASKVRPATMQNAAVKGAEEKAILNERSWSSWSDTARTNTDAANIALTHLNKADEAYKRLSPAERGFILGQAPAASANSQIVDTEVNAMILDLMNNIKGNASDKDVQRLEQSLVGRRLDPTAWAEIKEVAKRISEVSIEKEAFMSEARDRGYSYQDSEKNWNKFRNQNSIYDQIDADKKRAEKLAGKK